MRLGNDLTKRAGRVQGARFVDVTDLVCSGTSCPVVVDRTVLYRDDAHLTMTWVRELTDALERRLDLPAGQPVGTQGLTARSIPPP